MVVAEGKIRLLLDTFDSVLTFNLKAFLEVFLSGPVSDSITAEPTIDYFF